MSKKNYVSILMALVAMSCFRPTFSFAQEENKPRAFSPKIKTPKTDKDLKEDRVAVEEKPEIEEKESQAPFLGQTNPSSAAQRRIQQHGLGIGLGQTFLLGDYAKHGQDKITLDLLYTYTASYSFDLLINAHASDHEDDNGKMNVMGLVSSIKGRFVEYDNFSPYFLGGLGFYAPKAERGGEWTNQKVVFGLNFGGGVDLRLNEHYVVGLLGQMHWPFRAQQNNQSDLTGYYFKMLITGMYLF